jgi:hypothetical protein
MIFMVSGTSVAMPKARIFPVHSSGSRNSSISGEAAAYPLPGSAKSNSDYFGLQFVGRVS